MEKENLNTNKFIQILPEDEFKPNIQYMNKLIQASKLLNIWPKENKTFFNWVMFWVNIINFIFFTLTVTLRIIIKGKNMDEITETIDFVTVFISAIFRFIYVHIRGRKYLLLVSLMHNHFVYNSFFKNNCGITLKKYIDMAYRIILFYGCFTIFWILQFCLAPLITYIMENSKIELLSEDLNITEMAKKTPYPMAMKAYVPFNVFTQPTNAIFYLYQVLTLLNFGSIYLVIDSFWYMVILLTIGQFVLIKKSLSSISTILRKEESKNASILLEKKQINEVEHGLRKCIKHHQFMRKVVRLIDDIINPNILVDLLHAIISIAFILLDVTIALNNKDWNKVMYSLEYFITSVVHMFFFDWLGNELALKEEEIAEAVYDVSWYRCPELRINILLMVAQSRNPHRITGGKMYKPSLNFFASTIKAIFSYFTFLFQLRNKQ